MATYFEGVRKQVELRPVEILLDPDVPGAHPKVRWPFNDATRFWQPHDLHEAGHVAHQVVVDALLVENKDAVHLEAAANNYGPKDPKSHFESPTRTGFESNDAGDGEWIHFLGLETSQIL